MAQLWGSVRAFVSGVLLGVPLTAAFLDRVASVARVEGGSMQPVLNPSGGPRDVVLLVRWGRARRGDVVSLESPRDPRQRLIKRLLALEGDEVRRPGRAPLTVPRGHAWVEGDHRGRSLDSTSFGPVPLALLHARATHILWPPRRWQRLRSHLPPEGGGSDSPNQ